MTRRVTDPQQGLSRFRGHCSLDHVTDVEQSYTEKKGEIETNPAYEAIRERRQAQETTQWAHLSGNPVKKNMTR